MKKSSLTRRTALKVLGAGAVAATVGISPRGVAAQAAAPAPRPVSLPVEPFNLADVKLLDGPFKHAQDINEKYMLQLEPDRMLHNFRKNAGLQPKAPIYGGWESVATWNDVRAHGHTLGHYLTACALSFHSTGNAEFKKRADYCVAELQECQKAAKTGLVNAFPDNTAQLDNLIAGRRAIGVPWYTLHKIFAGLRDVHLLLGSAPAKEVLLGLADWTITATQNMTDAQFERMLAIEHGGMNEVLADVYAITGDAKYLKIAERFNHRAVLTPAAEGRDALNGLHANTQIPKFVGFQRLYELTGQERYKNAADFFWKTVVNNRSYATGGHGDVEHFFPLTEFQRRLSSAKTMETCCSHNMLRLTRHLFTLNPSGHFADFYERALYNTILASQDPDSGMVTYFQATRPGYLKLYCTPFDSFWCCTGTGIENHGKYGDSIYFKSKAGDALYVNLFIPSTLNWKEKNLTLTQTTEFPEEAKTRFEITATTPVDLTLHIRVPEWCAKSRVRINGTLTPIPGAPGAFMEIKRQWKTGDVIEIDLPMALKAVPLPGAPNRVAIMYGPIVLVGALGKTGINPGDDIWVNERLMGTRFNDPIEIPTFTAPPTPATILEKLKPVPNQPLTFKTENLAKPSEVTLIPYYKLAHERYNMYWQVNPT